MRLIRSVLAAALLAAVAVAVAAAPARAAGGLNVLPAVQRWIPGTGSYHFGVGTRLVLDPRFAAGLADTAATTADDIAAQRGVRPAVVTGDIGSVAPGDVHLSLDSTDSELGDEGYQLTVGAEVRVSAGTVAGAFAATRTLLQLLRQATVIPAGTARDWPRYRERGLMVDSGRKYFSVAWLASHIRELSYLKMNVFHWHLSDNLGFRLESTGHPEVVSAQHYTKQEVRNLLAVAARYHVVVVPEIDVPGHMDALLLHHPELKLTSASGVPSSGKIDITKPAAQTFVADLINEYLDLFPAPVWHAGADEYLTPQQYPDYPQIQQYARTHYGAGASPADAFLGFVNYLDRLVAGKGRRLRIWNDGLRGGVNVTVNPDIEVEYWSANGMSAAALAAAGHPMLNARSDFLYYVLGNGAHRADPAAMYAGFAPNLFAGSAFADADPHVRGAEMAIWCDLPNGQDEAQVARWVSPALRVLAQLVWGSPRPATGYADFAALGTAVGHAPGYVVGDPRAARALRLAVGTDAGGRLAAFAVRGGAVQMTAQRAPNATWVGWTTLGGRDLSAPTAGANADGRIELFAVDTDNVLYHKAQTPTGGWSDWLALGGRSVSPEIAIGRNSDGRLQVFAVGTDGSLYTAAQGSPNGAWGSWTGLGGTDMHVPVVGSDADGRLEVFVVGGDTYLHHRWQTTVNGPWSAWATRDGPRLSREMTVGRNADGRLQAFATGVDGSLYTVAQKSPNGSWATWVSLGGTDVHVPTVASDADGRLEVFVIGGDGQLFHKWQTSPGGGWSTWGARGGQQLSRDLAVRANADGRLQAFVIGGDGLLFTVWQTSPNGTWSGWLSLS
jgi:hypothetical protein